MVVFRLFEKLICSNERSTKFESLYHGYDYLEEKTGKMVALQISPKERVCMDWVNRPQNYKDLYGILQLLQGSHLDNFPLKTLTLGWVAFHSLTFQLKCLDFQCNQYKKLTPVLSRFWAMRAVRFEVIWPKNAYGPTRNAYGSGAASFH